MPRFPGGGGALGGAAERGATSHTRRQPLVSSGGVLPGPIWAFSAASSWSTSAAVPASSSSFWMSSVSPPTSSSTPDCSNSSSAPRRLHGGDLVLRPLQCRPRIT